MYIYKTCEDFKSFNIRKRAHISSINLQVECAPLRKCARPRPTVCTGGAAKIRKRNKHKHKFNNQPKILTFRIDSLTKHKSQGLNFNKIEIQRN